MEKIVVEAVASSVTEMFAVWVELSCSDKEISFLHFLPAKENVLLLSLNFQFCPAKACSERKVIQFPSFSFHWVGWEEAMIPSKVHYFLGHAQFYYFS